ncbi:MAG: isochorismatase family protein, partial [Zavarzinella sp.]|nr:isochorismatase family protein [Zavarzinella sp.]
VRDVGFLLDVANLLKVPALATEQYPQGLGPTNAELVHRLPPEPAAKVAFSSCGAPGLLAEMRRLGRSNVVVAGMETHVCVLHTTLDLLAEGLQVFLPVDAVQSRFRVDHDAALRRLERAGAIPTTAETVAFEWLGGSDHPQFKAVSKLIQERMKQLQG